MHEVGSYRNYDDADATAANAEGEDRYEELCSERFRVEKKCGESKGQTRLRANGCEEEFKNKRRRVGGRK